MLAHVCRQRGWQWEGECSAGCVSPSARANSSDTGAGPWCILVCAIPSLHPRPPQGFSLAWYSELVARQGSLHCQCLTCFLAHVLQRLLFEPYTVHCEPYCHLGRGLIPTPPRLQPPVLLLLLLSPQVHPEHMRHVWGGPVRGPGLAVTEHCQQVKRAACSWPHAAHLPAAQQALRAGAWSLAHLGQRCSFRRCQVHCSNAVFVCVCVGRVGVRCQPLGCQLFCELCEYQQPGWVGDEQAL